MYAALPSTGPDFRNAHYVQCTDHGLDPLTLGPVRDVSAIGEKRLALDPLAHLHLPARGRMLVAPSPMLPSLNGFLCGSVGFSPNERVIASQYNDDEVKTSLRPVREPTDAEIMAHPLIGAVTQQLENDVAGMAIQLANALSIIESASPELHRFLWERARPIGADDNATLIQGDRDASAVDDGAEEEKGYDPGAHFEVAARRLMELNYEQRLRLYTLGKLSGAMPTARFVNDLEAFLCQSALSNHSALALGHQPALGVADRVRAAIHGDPLGRSATALSALYSAMPFMVIDNLRLPVRIVSGRGIFAGDFQILQTTGWARASLVDTASGASIQLPQQAADYDSDTHQAVVEVTDWTAAWADIEGAGGWVQWDIGVAQAVQLVGRYQAGTPEERAQKTHIADASNLAARLFQIWICLHYLRSVEPSSLQGDRLNHVRAGMVRGYGVLRGLVGKSSEVHFLAAGDRSEFAPVFLVGALATQVFAEVMKPNRVIVAFATTLTSFMKSGHHSTAARLDNTLAKMLLSMRDESQLDGGEMPGFLGLAVHYGTHTFDMRLIFALFRHLNCYGLVNGAIGKRLAPEGPGNVAVVIGFKALTELNEAGFFRAVGRMSDYEDAKNAYELWAPTRWMELPYAAYMFGSSRAPDERTKQVITGLFPLLSTMKEVMPDSTYLGSIALNKEVTSASVNSIVAGLEVRAFARAFSQYLESSVTRALTRR